MAIHRDVSLVSPQGAYVAVRCPARAQCEVLRPCEPLPASSVAERRAERGRLFEAEVLGHLASLHPKAVVVLGGDVSEREATSAEALGAGAGMVLGGRLPTDRQGQRLGEPNILLRARGSAGYRAIDVKAHSTRDPGPSGTDVACSSLDAPAFEHVHQEQFSGPIAFSRDTFIALPEISQEMVTRLKLLDAILSDLTDSEGHEEDR